MSEVVDVTGPTGGEAKHPDSEDQPYGWPARGRAVGSDGTLVQGPTDGHAAVLAYVIKRKSSMCCRKPAGDMPHSNQQLGHGVWQEAGFHQGQLVREEAHRQTQDQVQCGEPCNVQYLAE